MEFGKNSKKHKTDSLDLCNIDAEIHIFGAAAKPALFSAPPKQKSRAGRIHALLSIQAFTLPQASLRAHRSLFL
jgi:hypothetical protein